MLRDDEQSDRNPMEKGWPRFLQPHNDRGVRVGSVASGLCPRGHLARLWIAFGALMGVGCNSIFDIEDPVKAEQAESTRSGDDEQTDAGTPCVLTSDCARSEVCIFRVCSPPCDADRDCERGARCLQTSDGRACVHFADTDCSANADCPEGTTCAGGECRNACEGTRAEASTCLGDQECREGTCVGTLAAHERSHSGSAEGGVSSAEAGSAANDAGEAPDGAGPNELEEGGAACEPGGAICTPEGLRQCDDGRWGSPEPCPYVCIAGQCTGECAPGNAKCSNGNAQTCNESGEWVETECDAACERGMCVDTCTEGRTDCSDETVVLCENGEWQEQEECDLLCEQGECTGECLPT